MPGNPACTLFIGNVDEKVDMRVLYEIMIQAGPIVDIYIPKDKETNRHKGYAFAEYETEEIAQYAIKLFSGLVCLYNRTLRFAISGQDKPSPTQNTARSFSNQTSPGLGNKMHPSSPYSHAEADNTARSSAYQTPPGFGNKMLPPSPYSHAKMNSRHLPYLSPVSNYSSAYNSRGAIKNGYNMEKISPQSQPNNNNSNAVEAKRFDSCLSSIHNMGHRASLHGSGYAYPSY